MAKVTITGGTGVLGRAVVPRLLADGHEVTVLTRRPAAPVPGGSRRMVGDLAHRDGLDAVVRGAEVVVHLASQPFRPARVDVGGTSALIEAVRHGGGHPHLVYVSIVGVGQIPWPYYKRKRQAEVLVSGSGLPYTIQRATQFHDLVLMAMASAARAPFLVIPSGTACQPVDVADVAERLAQIVRSGPVNGLGADLGGPQVLDAAELARDVLSALGRRRLVRQVRIPGRVGAGFRAVHHLTAGTPPGRSDMARLPGGPLQRRTRRRPAAIYREAARHPPLRTVPPARGSRWSRRPPGREDAAYGGGQADRRNSPRAATAAR